MHSTATNTLAHRSASLLAATLALWVAPAWSQDPPLFGSHTNLELRMTVDFDTLCRPSQDPACDFTATDIQVEDVEGAVWSLPVEIKRRDGWRAQQTNCQVPTLFVRFQPESAVGTVFEGQTELALTSHCGKGLSSGRSATLPDEFEPYVVSEYAGYRLYNLVTDASLRVRLVKIHYEHPTQPRRNMTRDAFFAEHFDGLAARMGSGLVPAERFDADRLDTHTADQLALFQFMIGNTDWSIPDQNNVVVLADPDGTQVPVLYDLDQSGLVNAHYASPSEHLPIGSVKQRLFLGHCHADSDWDALFEKFRRLEPRMRELIFDVPGLGRGDRRAALAYLDGFFEVLFSEEARRDQIIEACLREPDANGIAHNH